MFLKNIKLDVIASFDNHEQDHFELRFLSKDDLKNEKSLLDYIFKQLNNTDDLYKLSLCWMCSDDTVKKYDTIKESIDKNAKYFFEKGELIA
jgi:hypothetical protein